MQQIDHAMDVKSAIDAQTTMADLGDMFGIQYLAPCDMRKTDFAPSTFDSISSTATLEHIPAEDIALILAECRRLLKPNRIISCLIGLKDHYAYCDKHVSIYNFLRFSERRWAFCNSALHFQNRLRYAEYVNLFLKRVLRPLFAMRNSRLIPISPARDLCLWTADLLAAPKIWE